jgi:HEXXH motif-containing protein
MTPKTTVAVFCASWLGAAVLLTNIAVAKALTYLPRQVDLAVPSFNFNIEPHFAHLNWRPIPEGKRELAQDQLSAAFRWCGARFPLVLEDSTAVQRPSIAAFVVGESAHEDELLSASSAQAPGAVLMVAPWPLKCIYRVASLIAHESMHQALYERERQSSPVRRGSLGYSPWKYTLRPGRLVWHSFWTFLCQHTLLAECALLERDVLLNDPDLKAFLADMRARILLCADSLRDFDVLNLHELGQRGDALDILQELERDLRQVPGYSQISDWAEHEVFAGYEEWSREILANPPPKLSIA